MAVASEILLLRAAAPTTRSSPRGSAGGMVRCKLYNMDARQTTVGFLERNHSSSSDNVDTGVLVVAR